MIDSSKRAPRPELVNALRTALGPYRVLSGLTGTLPIEDLNNALIDLSVTPMFRDAVLGDLGWECFRREPSTEYQYLPTRCDGNWCATCGPRRAFWTGAAIDLAQPTHLLTITRMGATWNEVQGRMRSITRDLRRWELVFEMAWHAEEGHRRDGGHVHGWYRGPHIITADLAAVSRNAGAGWDVDITPISRRSPRGMGYGVKEISNSRLLPLPAAVAMQQTYHRLNGTRLVHNTNGFWRDENGEPTNLSGAIAAAKRVHRSGGAEAA